MLEPTFIFMSGVNTLSGVRRILTADCYVLASGLDCCPTKILEASLMRKPVIARSVAGVPETVLEDRTGWTIQNESTMEWIQKINFVMKDATLSRRPGERGRVCFRGHLAGT